MDEAKLLEVFARMRKRAAAFAAPSYEHPGMLTFARARALALHPSSWTEEERHHVAECRRCQRLVTRFEKERLHSAMQRRVAQVAIDAATVRGQGEKGVVKAARTFLTSLDLRRFATPDENTFELALKETTEELERFFPGNARSWGLARKCLNVFLRDAFYNFYLCNEFGLSQAEQWYEVPLDSHVVSRLKKKAGRGVLPAWNGIKQLREADSTHYQRYASMLAQREGLPARVHLDLYLWRSEDSPEEAGQDGTPAKIG